MRTPKTWRAKIDDSEMMSHILSNLPEEYQTIKEILEDKLDYNSEFITIERIRDNILVNYDQITNNKDQKFQEEMKLTFT